MSQDRRSATRPVSGHFPTGSLPLVAHETSVRWDASLVAKSVAAGLIAGPWKKKSDVVTPSTGWRTDMNLPFRSRSLAIRSIGLVLILATAAGCKPPPSQAPTATPAPSGNSPAVSPGQNGTAASAPIDLQSQWKASKEADSEDVKRLFAMGAYDRPVIGRERQSITNETLKEVWFNWNGTGFGIDDNDFMIIDKFPNLTRISITGEKITDASLPLIAKKKALKYLELRAVPITDAGITLLKDLTELESLNLSGTSITGEGLTALSDLTKLKSLYLRQCPNINDGSIEHLARLKTLTKLDVEATGVSTKGGEQLKAALPNCTIFVSLR